MLDVELPLKILRTRVTLRSARELAIALRLRSSGAVEMWSRRMRFLE